MDGDPKKIIGRDVHSNFFSGGCEWMMISGGRSCLVGKWQGSGRITKIAFLLCCKFFVTLLCNLFGHGSVIFHS